MAPRPGGLAGLESTGQVNSLEIQVKVDVTVLSLKTVWRQSSSFFRKSQSLRLRLIG